MAVAPALLAASPILTFAIPPGGIVIPVPLTAAAVALMLPVTLTVVTALAPTTVATVLPTAVVAVVLAVAIVPIVTAAIPAEGESQRIVGAVAVARPIGIAGGIVGAVGTI